MNHVRPDLQGHGHIGGSGRRGEARCVGEQGLGGTHLNKRRRQTFQIGIKRGNLRIFPVHASAKISIGEFAEIGFVKERINGVLGDKGRRQTWSDPSMVTAARHKRGVLLQNPADD